MTRANELIEQVMLGEDPISVVEDRHVDTSLWTINRKFGPAGGPDQFVLTDKGRMLAAKVAANMKEKPIIALEALAARGGIDQIEFEVGTTIRISPYAKEHGGPDALGVLLHKGYVRLLTSKESGKDRVRVYKITKKGYSILKDIEEEREYLLNRVKTTQGTSKK